MKITTKGCYGIRAMIELASSSAGQPVSMETIAENRDISRKYLHSLLTALRSAGLVRSVRGPGGGFVLARPADEIFLDEILRALEGSLSPSSCADEPESCSRSGFCPMVAIWNHISDVVADLLAGVSLAKVCEDERRRLARSSGEGDGGGVRRDGHAPSGPIT